MLTFQLMVPNNACLPLNMYDDNEINLVLKWSVRKLISWETAPRIYIIIIHKTLENKTKGKKRKNIYKLITRDTAEDLLQASYVVMVPMGDDYLVNGSIVVLQDGD